MNAGIIGFVFIFVWLIFAIPAAVFLLRAYGRSKMSGFLWLFGALIVWPFVARILTPLIGVLGFAGATRGLNLGAMHLNFFILLSLAETLVGGVLLLTAVVILDRELASRLVVSPMVPPPAVKLENN